MVDCGPWKPDTCPNGPACPHGIERHLFNPDTERWECTIEDCRDNPERVVTIYSPAAMMNAESYRRLLEAHGPRVQLKAFEYPHIGTEQGIDVHQVDMEDLRPRRRWRWRR